MMRYRAASINTVVIIKNTNICFLIGQCKIVHLQLVPIYFIFTLFMRIQNFLYVFCELFLLSRNFLEKASRKPPINYILYIIFSENIPISEAVFFKELDFKSSQYVKNSSKNLKLYNNILIVIYCCDNIIYKPHKNILQPQPGEDKC